MKHKFTLFIATAFLIGSSLSMAAHKPYHKTYKYSGSKTAAAENRRVNAAPSYSHGLAVVASPFIGEHDIYDIKNLIVNLPLINTDVNLLKQRQKLENYARRYGYRLPDRPLVDLSGSLETQLLYNSRQFAYTDDVYQNNDSEPGHSLFDLDLTRVELDVVAEVGPWITGAIFFGYENSLHKINFMGKEIPLYGSRVAHSKVNVDRAFIIIGNLNKSPYYFTMGQIYVPFGNYSTVRITDPLTKMLGRTKARSALFGYDNCGINASVYVFRGDSYVNNDMTINQAGVNIDYRSDPAKDIVFNIGAGYIGNIADSVHMQVRQFGPFPVFFERLYHRVPAVNIHGAIDIDSWKFSAEYVGAVRNFDDNDLSFFPADLYFDPYLHRGAKPQALTIEGSYRFYGFNRLWQAGVGYDRSWEALGLLMPKDSFFVALGTSMFKYTIQSLEFRHNSNYKLLDMSKFDGGYGILVIPPRKQNIITLQFGIYF